MWPFLQIRNYFLGKINNEIIVMFKLTGQVVLWWLYTLDTSELCHRAVKDLTWTQPTHWMELAFWPMTLTYYTHLFTGFTIRTLLRQLKGDWNQRKVLEFSKRGGREGTTQEKFLDFVCLILPPLPHPFPQLGLPDNIQDIQKVSHLFQLMHGTYLHKTLLIILTQIYLGVLYFHLLTLSIPPSMD